MSDKAKSSKYGPRVVSPNVVSGSANACELSTHDFSKGAANEQFEPGGGRSSAAA